MKISKTGGVGFKRGSRKRQKKTNKYEKKYIY
jgi:hypothetical protein